MEYKNIFSDYPDVVNIDDLTHMLGIGKNKAWASDTQARKKLGIGIVQKILAEVARG